MGVSEYMWTWIVNGCVRVHVDMDSGWVCQSTCGHGQSHLRVHMLLEWVWSGSISKNGCGQNSFLLVTRVSVEVFHYTQYRNYL